MNQLEQLREQCAKVANKFVGAEQIVEEIRALPLPAVSVLDFGADPTGETDSSAAFQNAIDHVSLESQAEALRKENEQLKESLRYLIEQAIEWQNFATGCEQEETEEMKLAKERAK